MPRARQEARPDPARTCRDSLRMGFSCEQQRSRAPQLEVPRRGTCSVSTALADLFMGYVALDLSLMDEIGQHALHLLVVSFAAGSPHRTHEHIQLDLLRHVSDHGLCCSLSVPHRYLGNGFGVEGALRRVTGLRRRPEPLPRPLERSAMPRGSALASQAALRVPRDWIACAAAGPPPHCPPSSPGRTPSSPGSS